MSRILYGGELNAGHKTNLQLINEAAPNNEFLSPVVWREIQVRKLGFLFSPNRTLQEIYEKCKLKNIDLLFTRE